MRRSPGGSRPRSRRSRPDEPPSSATVTSAVGSTPTRRSAARVTERPWPPPTATTLLMRVPAPSPALDVAVADVDAEVQAGEPGGQLLGQHHAAVAAAGAADRDGQVLLALAHVAGQGDLEQVAQAVHEQLGLVQAEHIVAHRG